MRTLIFVMIGLLAASWTPAFAQADVFFVPNPETAIWSYRETNHPTGEVRLVEYSVQKMTGDAVNGQAEVRMLNQKMGEEAPADTTFLLYRFDQGELILDLGAMFSGDLFVQMMESSGAMESVPAADRDEFYQKLRENIEVSGQVRGVPRYPEVGKLPDYELKIKLLFFNIKIRGKARKITGVETVKTPAGDYECFVLTEDVSTKAMMSTEKSRVKTWYAYGIGVVKQENYDDDELTSTLLLDTINW